MHFKSNDRQQWQCRGCYDDNYHHRPHPYHHGHHHLSLGSTDDAKDAAMTVIITVIVFKSNVKQHWQCRGCYDENYHHRPHPCPHYHHGHHHLLLAGTGDAEDATMIVIITVIKPVEPTSYINRSVHLRRTTIFVASKRNVLLVLC